MARRGEFQVQDFCSSLPTQTLDSQAALRKLSERFLHTLKRHVDYEWGAVYVLDRTVGQLRCVAHHGEEIDFIASFRFRYGKGLSAWVLEKKKPVVLHNIHHGRRHRHHPVRSFASFPIMNDNLSIGSLTLGHHNPHAFTERECQYLERAARSLWRVIVPFVVPPA